MKIFVYDTETSGLPSKKKELEDQPHLIQFAGILVDMKDDGTYEELGRINQLVNPPIPIPYVTSQIHNIFDIDVADKKDFSFYSDEFFKWGNDADAVCGHNVSFDESIMNIEAQRMKMAGSPVDYNPKQLICTMKESKDWCRMPRKNSNLFKNPKLSELYKKIFNEFFSGAHDAIVDVERTLDCLSHLVKEGVISLEDRSEIRLF